MVGCPRSGTTWVRNLLAQHPRVITGRESHAYPQIVGAVTDLGLHGAALWRRVLDRHRRGRRRGFDAGLHTWTDRRSLARWIAAAWGTPELDDLAAAERVVHAIFDDHFVRHGGTAEHLLVEKSPNHVHFVDRILTGDPEARVVEVLRDGRDVCVSLGMRGRTQAWAPTDRRRQIATWTSAVSAGLAVREDPRWSGRILLVRFEDLKADRMGETARLLAFVGLPADRGEIARMLDAVAIERNPRRHEGGHVRSGAVGDWHAHFSDEDRRLFDRLAGDLARRVGYEVSP